MEEEIKELIDTLIDIRELYDDIDNPFRTLGVLFKGTESDEEMLEKLLGKDDLITDTQQPSAASSNEYAASTNVSTQQSSPMLKHQSPNIAKEQCSQIAASQQQSQIDEIHQQAITQNRTNNDVLAEMAATKLLIKLLGHLDSGLLSNFVKLNLITQENANKLETISNMYGKVRRNIEVIDIITSGYILHMLNTSRNDELMSLLAVLELNEDDRTE